jgi:hypothetical protein
MKLGSFLLFSEAEVGTILTDNVLGTKLDTDPGSGLRVCWNRTGAGTSSARSSMPRALEYYFNPTWSIYARYEHTNFFSTDSGSDVLENEVRVGMRIRH